MAAQIDTIQQAQDYAWKFWSLDLDRCCNWRPYDHVAGNGYRREHPTSTRDDISLVPTRSPIGRSNGQITRQVKLPA